jgi:hypothetical protein
MNDVKVKTGETYCQQCQTLVATRMDSREMYDEDKKLFYWEVFLYCKTCGCLVYSYNIYQTKEQT